MVLLSPFSLALIMMALFNGGKVDATAPAAASSTNATAAAAPAANIKCNSPFTTYKVNGPADGIACVQMSGAGNPNVVVYVEGRVNQKGYRILAYGNGADANAKTFGGRAMSPSNAEDLNCGGYLDINFAFSGATGSENLIISNAKDPSKSLNLTKSATGVSFSKLPALKSCGSNYKTFLMAPNANEKGFRCALPDASNKVMALVGPGSWKNNFYCLIGLLKTNVGFSANDRGFGTENAGIHDFGFFKNITMSPDGSSLIAMSGTTPVPWNSTAANFNFDWTGVANV